MANRDYLRGLYGMTIFRNRSESVRNFKATYSGGGPVAVAGIDPMAGDDCDSFLAEQRSQSVGTFAAAAGVVGIDSIGNLDGYPDRGASATPLGVQDDVGGEYAVLLLERDTAVVGGLRDRFGELRGGLLHGTLDDPRAPQPEVLTDQGLNPSRRLLYIR